MTNLTAIYQTAEIRKVERIATALTNPPNLMEKAGLAAAQIAANRLLNNTQDGVLILAGPGNNGGDAFVVARYLKQWQFKVTLVLTVTCQQLPYDAKQALDAWLAVEGEIQYEIPTGKIWNLVIDGLLGIGLSQHNNRKLEGKYRQLVNLVNAMSVPILALDIPSGLGSDDGCVYGVAIRATITVTFIGLKTGLFTNNGVEYCGEIILCELDLDLSAWLVPHIWIINKQLVNSLLPPPRAANSHKGTFGSVGIIGGSSGMVGAALLSGKAALKLGSGRVYLGLIATDVLTVDTTQPELMLRKSGELFKLNNLNCLVVGPGMGINPGTCSWLDQALDTNLPLVLDADALNHIAVHAHLAKKLQQRKAPTILTPHAAEAARLLGKETVNIQNDRMAAAMMLAQRFNCYAVLKGAGSICVTPDGKYYINTSGNPGLSSAGTGDVLSGILGALLTQGLNVEQSLLLAVYLHGAAADVLLQKQGGPLGMTASELINSARYLLNKWIYSGDSVNLSTNILNCSADNGLLK